MYLHLGGTHVHHLNYGIFLLAAVGGVPVAGPSRRVDDWQDGTLYGVGLALTFDEFGLWLHLGGGYWQRASFDAVVVIAALLGLILIAPRFRSFRLHHWATAIALAIATVVFSVRLVDSFKYADRLLLRVQIIEPSHPPLP